MLDNDSIILDRIIRQEITDYKKLGLAPLKVEYHNFQSVLLI